MFQNAPDLYPPKTESAGLKVIKQSKELLNGFSKKDIAKRFVAFLQEECKDLGLDEKEIKSIINRLTKYYSKKKSVKDLQSIISNIESLFTNQNFISRLEYFLSNSHMTDFAKMFFYKNGELNYKNLKDSLLARLKRYNLSYKAIGNLSKKEILDVLQVNNRFRDEDKINHSIIDVKGRGKDKIFLLQNYKEAKIIDGKLVIIHKEETKIENNKKSIENPILTAIGNDEKDINNNSESKKDKNEDKDTIEGQSGKIYKKIEGESPLSFARDCIKIIDEQGNKFWLPIFEGKVLDICISNNGKKYTIVDYISAYINTGTIHIVDVKDEKGHKKSLRFFMSKNGKFMVEEKINIEKKGFSYNLSVIFHKLFYGKILKKMEPVFVEKFLIDNGDFFYILDNGNKINIYNAYFIDPN